MDYSDCNETFRWEEGDYYIEKNPSLDISECVWDGTTCEEDFPYMIEEDTTPIKACGVAPHHFSNNVTTILGKTSKLSDRCKETYSQVKRRRMLQFSNEEINLAIQSDDSAFLKSKERLNVIDEAFLEASQLEGRFQESSCSSILEGLDESEDWLADCLNYDEMNDSPADIDSTSVRYGPIDVTEFSGPAPSAAAEKSHQQTVKASRSIIFKGRKSFMRTPTKLASSVAYPFTFIKPSGVNGDVTLKEINQRIRIPPPMKPKEVDPVTYGTSAITGKPVINRTRIRTEGGKGSITIMRTKG